MTFDRAYSDIVIPSGMRVPLEEIQVETNRDEGPRGRASKGEYGLNTRFGLGLVNRKLAYTTVRPSNQRVPRGRNYRWRKAHPKPLRGQSRFRNKRVTGKLVVLGGSELAMGRTSSANTTERLLGR